MKLKPIWESLKACRIWSTCDKIQHRWNPHYLLYWDRYGDLMKAKRNLFCQAYCSFLSRLITCSSRHLEAGETGLMALPWLVFLWFPYKLLFFFFFFCKERKALPANYLANDWKGFRNIRTDWLGKWMWDVYVTKIKRSKYNILKSKQFLGIVGRCSLSCSGDA